MTLRLAPRSFLTIALGVIGVLVGILGVLGWKLLDQERALEQKAVGDRLTNAADLAVNALKADIDAARSRLGALAATPDAPAREAALSALGISGDDAVVAVFAPSGLWTSKPLVFYPDVPDRVDAAAPAFAPAESLELSGRTQEALTQYQRLTVASDPTVRAGAWLRVARTSRTLRKTDVALAALDNLAQYGSVAVAGRPADLVALVERYKLLADEGRRDAALSDQIGRGLAEGRWPLSRGEYYAYKLEFDRPPTDSQRTAELLAAAVSTAARELLKNGEGAISARPSPAGVVQVSSRAAEATAVLVATPAFVERAWLGRITSMTDRQRARVALTGEGVRWSMSTTGLPFDLVVSSTDPDGDHAAFATRRFLLTAVLVIVVLVLIAGGYAVARGVSRELEVARLQSDFVAAVSHEFRTPVASVRQLAEVLDDGRVQDAERRTKYYGLLRRESERLQRLVESLLDFGRMESNAAEYRFNVVSAGELVAGVAREFNATANGDGGRIASTVPADLPEVRVDRDAISRAVWNLLDNAVKYSPPMTPITIQAEAASDRVVIRVHNEGEGIPAEEQSQIFQKFVRGSSARASGARGTGLGLAMVARIMSAHQGEVRVESRPGAGVTFSLVLPIETERVAS